MGQQSKEFSAPKNKRQIPPALVPLPEVVSQQPELLLLGMMWPWL